MISLGALKLKDGSVQQGLAFLRRGVEKNLTTDAYVWAVREFPMVPWLPVLQGWRLPDYLRHLAAYQDRGIDLRDAPLVGVGELPAGGEGCVGGDGRGTAA